MLTMTFAMVTLGIATAINPLGVSIVVLLLMSKGGLRKAGAFVLGSTLAIVAASLLALLLTWLAIKASGTSTHAGAAKLLGVGELAFGVGMLVLGVWTMTRGSAATHNTMDKLMQDSDSVKAWVAFGMGLMFVSYTVPFVAVAELSAAHIPDPIADLTLYIIYLLCSLLSILVPIVMMVVWPERSEKFLTAAREWLTDHAAPVTAIVFIALGAAFGLRGFSALFG